MGRKPKQTVTETKGVQMPPPEAWPRGRDATGLYMKGTTAEDLKITAAEMDAPQEPLIIHAMKGAEPAGEVFVAADVDSNNLLPPPAEPGPGPASPPVTIGVDFGFDPPITHWPPPLCGQCPATRGKTYLPPGGAKGHVCSACGKTL
jgi:hypothetical protein